MEVKIKLNGKAVVDDIPADMLLIDFVRAHGCKSVKRGCETSACGLCTVMLDDVPVLSCSTLAARADGRSVCTLEGLQDEASEFVGFIADQGAEQCGFCNPGFVMNTIALLRENPDPTDDEILAYLSGNLCRCSGYVGQLRGHPRLPGRKAWQGGRAWIGPNTAPWANRSVRRTRCSFCWANPSIPRTSHPMRWWSSFCEAPTPTPW